MIDATAHQRRPLTLRLMRTRRNERGRGFFKSGSMALYQPAPQPQRGFSPAANGRDRPESPDHRRPTGCGILLRAKPYHGMGWRRMHRGGPSEVHPAARTGKTDQRQAEMRLTYQTYTICNQEPSEWREMLRRRPALRAGRRLNMGPPPAEGGRRPHKIPPTRIQKLSALNW
jgi:hypothetical protein